MRKGDVQDLVEKVHYLEQQRKSADEMVRLVQDVKRGTAAEIECDAVVFVFTEHSQPLSQQEPHSTQGIKPKAGVGAGP